MGLGERNLGDLGGEFLCLPARLLWSLLDFKIFNELIVDLPCSLTNWSTVLEDKDDSNFFNLFSQP